MNAKWILLGGALWSCPVAYGQNLETQFRKNGDKVTSAFEDQRAILQRSSAVIREGRKELAYGVVVSADGYILTKASEVEKSSTLTVLIDAAKYEGAKVVAKDPTWDVALLKVHAEGLTPVEFATQPDLSQGTWVVANGATSLSRRRALVGIISAKAREIPAAGGAGLGVVLKPSSKQLEIAEVNASSGAQKAGIQKGDVLISIDDQKITKVEEVAKLLKERKAGQKVSVQIKRKGEELKLEVELVSRGQMFDEKTRNDQMSGDYSERRTGFPRVIQHDILGNKESVGGPLLDLDGHCVGMNIARADRAQSFAIPSENVKELAERLMKEAAAK